MSPITPITTIKRNPLSTREVEYVQALLEYPKSYLGGHAYMVYLIDPAEESIENEIASVRSIDI